MANYNSKIHNRKSIRLKGYDYSKNGLYFITMCCYDRLCLFGQVQFENNIPPNNNSSPNQKIMVLNHAGRIANDCWLDIPNHFPHAILHEYIIMPNHIHGIIELSSPNGKPEKIIRANIDSPERELENITRANIDSPERELENTVAANNYSLRRESEKEDRANNYSPRRESEKENRLNNYSQWRSPSMTIGSVVRGFKIGVTKWMRQNTNVHEVWQRNYYEHIIRDKRAYDNITNYIIKNPEKWNMDRFYKSIGK